MSNLINQSEQKPSVLKNPPVPTPVTKAGWSLGERDENGEVISAKARHLPEGKDKESGLV